MNDKIGGMLDDGASEGAEEVGKWELFTLTQNGKSYMEDDLKAKGVESNIQINADGTGQIFHERRFSHPGRWGYDTCVQKG